MSDAPENRQVTFDLTAHKRAVPNASVNFWFLLLYNVGLVPNDEQNITSTSITNTSLQIIKAPLPRTCLCYVWDTTRATLYLCGSVKSLLQYGADSAERWHHLPAGPELTGTRNAVTLTLHLHVVEDSLAGERWGERGG